jgi:hypothetical protein
MPAGQFSGRLSSRNVKLFPPASVERWCERFAVALLVPPAWLNTYFGTPPDLRQFRRLEAGPSVFKVSKQAFYGAVFEEFRVAVAVCELGKETVIREVYPRFLEANLRQAVSAGHLRPTPSVEEGKVWGPVRITLPGSDRPVRWLVLPAST